jgi:hypothetical protein
MPVPVYTDLFNEAIDDLTATLQTITGLQVVNDPRNIVPPCIFIDAPSFEAWNYNIVKLTFPIKVISLGPGNLDAQRNILSLCAELLAKNVAVTAGRPTSLDIGGTLLPAYDLTIPMQAQTS